MATKKVNGFAFLRDGDRHPTFTDDATGTKTRPATLVIHDGPAEEVMTLGEHQEKVRAMVKDVLLQCFPESTSSPEHNDLVSAFGGHGITL